MLANLQNNYFVYIFQGPFLYSARGKPYILSRILPQLPREIGEEQVRGMWQTLVLSVLPEVSLPIINFCSNISMQEIVPGHEFSIFYLASYVKLSFALIALFKYLIFILIWASFIISPYLSWKCAVYCLIMCTKSHHFMDILNIVC